MIVVEAPGLRTTVQDRGRLGFAHLGVSPSGAADAFSMRLANALVGNDEWAAVLETTVVGPALRFGADAAVALAGAPAPARVDDRAVPFGHAIFVRAGELLRVGRATHGLRTYVAVAGGIDVTPVLGSRSTDTLSGVGPAPLVRGAVLATGAASGRPPVGIAPAGVVEHVLPHPSRSVRVILGPETGRFTAGAAAALRSEEFVVSPRADRVGARLTGPPLDRLKDGEAPTKGMVAGAIQVPPDGAPIVLLADHAVTGGYPVIAVVVAADLPLVAQSRPGTALRFRPASVAEASRAWADAEEQLAGVRLPRG